VERERLTAELLASQEALQESRARLVEAADRERRRIAQDLHDGLQPTLVLLALDAQRLAFQPGTPAATAADATKLRERIDAAAGELRELVHAIMPAPLIELGLAAAARDLADRMPVPVDLDLRLDGALPRPIATTAYFVLAEGLANALRHAMPTSVAVRLSSHAALLTVEVTDDGVGGAAPGSGLGLRGLIDRVEAVGGRLVVDSPAGHGTRITAQLPCAITAAPARSLVTEP
jgi:signal transduction histidine kinase